jgi:hypothetical protein
MKKINFLLPGFYLIVCLSIFLLYLNFRGTFMPWSNIGGEFDHGGTEFVENWTIFDWHLIVNFLAILIISTATFLPFILLYLYTPEEKSKFVEILMIFLVFFYAILLTTIFEYIWAYSVINEYKELSRNEALSFSAECYNKNISSFVFAYTIIPVFSMIFAFFFNIHLVINSQKSI